MPFRDKNNNEKETFWGSFIQSVELSNTVWLKLLWCSLCSSPTCTELLSELLTLRHAFSCTPHIQSQLSQLWSTVVAELRSVHSQTKPLCEDLNLGWGGNNSISVQLLGTLLTCYFNPVWVRASPCSILCCYSVLIQAIFQSVEGVVGLWSILLYIFSFPLQLQVVSNDYASPVLLWWGDPLQLEGAWRCKHATDVCRGFWNCK